jgi:hypothetical protein
MWGAIAGALIGGGIAYHVTKQQHGHEMRLEQQRRLLASLEAIHEVLSTIAHQAGILNVGVLGDIGYNSKFKGDLLKERMPVERLDMLVDFYAPTLKPDVQAINKQLELLARIVSEIILKKDRGDDWNAKTVEHSTIAFTEINRLVKEAKQKLALLVQPIVARAG